MGQFGDPIRSPFYTKLFRRFRKYACFFEFTSNCVNEVSVGYSRTNHTIAIFKRVLVVYCTEYCSESGLSKQTRRDIAHSISFCAFFRR